VLHRSESNRKVLNREPGRIEHGCCVLAAASVGVGFLGYALAHQLDLAVAQRAPQVAAVIEGDNRYATRPRVTRHPSAVALPLASGHGYPYSRPDLTRLTWASMVSGPCELDREQPVIVCSNDYQ
jgi:hypothetical protein